MGAWDKLYAELAGTVVDYGKAHSERCNHPRFGTDYSKKPLMNDFENSRIVLFGHSFGGATMRLFSEILVNGSEEERNNTDESDLSSFFKGGDSDKIFALVTLAAPSNGTTAYDMYEDEGFDVASIEIPEKYIKADNLVSGGTRAKKMAG